MPEHLLSLFLPSCSRLSPRELWSLSSTVSPQSSLTQCEHTACLSRSLCSQGPSLLPGRSRAASNNAIIPCPPTRPVRGALEKPISTVQLTDSSWWTRGPLCQGWTFSGQESLWAGEGRRSGRCPGELGVAGRSRINQWGASANSATAVAAVWGAHGHRAEQLLPPDWPAPSSSFVHCPIWHLPPRPPTLRRPLSP